MPNFDRLNPVTGLARVFSMRGVIELGKGAGALHGRGAGCAGSCCASSSTAFQVWAPSRPRLRIGHALSLVGTALIALGGALGVIAVVDVPLALWQYHKSLRMTRQEMRDENKETRGQSRDQVARAPRAAELARKRMMQEVPKADVVITNPTHYAVALRYDEQRMRAPIVVAKGGT